MFCPRELGYLFFRLAVSAMMLGHGVPKLMKLFTESPIKFADPIGVGVTFSLILAVFSEVVCSVFIMIGYKVRFMAIPLVITMAVAAFMVHGSDPWMRKEKAVLYLVTYIVMALMGSGKLSLDDKLNR